MPDNISGSISTTGRVTVGNSLTGEIETTNDSDAYAVELVAGRTYRIDLEGAATGKGTLADPFLRWLRDSSGNGLHGTRDYDGGEGLNPRQVFTPQVSGTYYITASGQGDSVGTYTLRVTDTSAPVFGASAYGFQLAENTDGGATRVSLGTVSATDPEGASVGYSIVGGNESGSFEIDAASGELFYKGSGEDYESDATSYDLTVRASDGQLTADTTVTVTVTDVAEAPAFGQQDYTFELAENADGSTTRVSLGMVSATDPEGASVGYSIEGGNESGSFEIDAQTGELFYVGAGEDYEAGAAQFDLTIRASDGTLTADAAVSVAITDVPEQTIVVPADPEILQTVSELAGEDFSTNISTAGRIVVDDTATGNIGTRGDRDWFAVELVADREYQIDLRGSPTGDGTLSDPYLRGIKGPDGRLIAGVSDDDGGEGYNSQLNFTPTESGPHYIIAGAYSGQGTYEVEVRDVSPQTAQQETVNGPPVFDCQGYQIIFAENADGSTNRVSLGTDTATDPDDDPVAYSIENGNASGLFEIDAQTGELFYVGSGEDYEAGSTPFYLTVRASDGTNSTNTIVTVNVGDVAEGLAFGQESYVFSLAENADGGTDRVSLGTVTATDPDDDPVAYSIEGGNESGSFEIDWTSGELFYVGTGEDYEAGSTPFYLTVRASDGTNSTDTTVTVNVGDVQEAPAFGQESYEFTLAENTDGLANRVSLGAVTATDPDDDPVAYSIEGGNASGLFEIDAQTGELFYVGAGEDYEAGAAQFDLTIRASDGTLTADAAVSVAITDVPEQTIVVPADPEVLQSVSEPNGEDFPANTSTIGRVAVDGTVTGKISRSGDRDWFAVELVAGGTYTFDLRGSPTGDRTLGDPYLRGLHDAEGNLISGTEDNDGGEWYNSRVTFTASETGTYYIAAGAFSGRGTYELVVSLDKYGDDVDTAGAVHVGGTAATGRIQYEGDRDWFAVTLEAGKTYLFDMEMDSESAAEYLAGGVYPGGVYLRAIHNPDGRYIPFTWDHTPRAYQHSQLAFKPDADGTYYVEATSGEGSWWTGDYTFRATEIEDDFAASTETTGTVVVGGSAIGEIEYADDRDWFAVELEADKTYQIDVHGEINDGGTLFRADLYAVYDDNGNRLYDVHDHVSYFWEDTQVFFTPDQNGTYYLSASNNRWLNTGTYTVRVAEIEDDFPATVDTTGSVDVGGISTGEIQYEGDHDWFAVELTAGETYKIELLGTRSIAGTLQDPHIRGIHDADGRLISDTTDYSSGPNANSEVLFTPNADGTYFIAAGSLLGGGAGEEVGTYTLQVAKKEEASRFCGNPAVSE